MLVTVGRYRAITGDQATSDGLVSARLEEAGDLLEEELGRPLAQVERTERMWPTRDGLLWPLAVPIADAEGYTIDGYSLKPGSAFPFVTNFEATYTEVVYTGGWVERSANPSSAYRLPRYIERDLAFAAQALGTRSAAALAQIPAGATSVRLGDAAITFDGGYDADPADAGVRWSRETLSHRYVRVGGYPDPTYGWP